MMMSLTLLISWTVVEATPAAGPLRVHPTNPRYFTDGSGKAIYLTSSHHRHKLQDAGRLKGPVTKEFDYQGYLELPTGK